LLCLLSHVADGIGRIYSFGKKQSYGRAFCSGCDNVCVPPKLDALPPEQSKRQSIRNCLQGMKQVYPKSRQHTFHVVHFLTLGFELPSPIQTVQKTTRPIVRKYHIYIWTCNISISGNIYHISIGISMCGNITSLYLGSSIVSIFWAI